MDFVIAAEQPDAPDVVALIDTHFRFARAASDQCNAHAMEADALAGPDVTFFTCRSADDEGLLLGIGALKTLDAEHGEIKSMHTTAPARGFGIGWAILNHLADTAQDRGMGRLSLETGTQDEFGPARSLYVSAGFVACPPFAAYEANDDSVFMSRELAAPVDTPLDGADFDMAELDGESPSE